MSNLYLYPRLNYKHSLKDFFISIQGLFKREFDDYSLQTIFEARDIVHYNHARTALRVLLSSLELKADSGVAMMAYNCLTVLNSIDAAGLKPVFIDVNDDFSMNMSDIKNKRNLFDVIIVNHMFGIPNKAIFEIRKHFPDILIIEDCTHSFLTSANGKLTGTIGDFSIFSYGKAKFPSVLDGGFLVINNQQYLNKIIVETQKINKPSFSKELRNIIKGLSVGLINNPYLYKVLKSDAVKNLDNKHDYTGKYQHVEYKAYKSSRNILNYRLKTIDKQLDKQKENGLKLRAVIDKDKLMFEGDYNFFMLPLLVENRDLFIKRANESCAELGSHFSKTILWAKSFGYKIGDCPNSEWIAKHIVTVPTHYNMKKKQIKIIKQILNVYL